MRTLDKRVVGTLLAATVGLTSATIVSGPAEAAPPARIKGVVTRRGNRPLAGIHVSTLEWHADIDLWVEADSDTTGVDGAYSVGKLVSGHLPRPLLRPVAAPMRPSSTTTRLAPSTRTPST